ncbi:uncharacterized protein I206_104379 [Kwoniella pini CBS 10737]|uniref:Calcium uniporter protein, mitochondrial n=1 Tax=Kwoniella pini CBS 10737 TaxID=1296096 RepID=A0A1B9I1V7_9TREE|nr:uncharacterized protein I206_04040 [Kwoniella pini CBS 10737]OCF49519.1 hypothetical protein I206_04040 [Kwoniella pini CBS 10737]
MVPRVNRLIPTDSKYIQHQICFKSQPLKRISSNLLTASPSKNLGQIHIRHIHYSRISLNSQKNAATSTSKDQQTSTSKQSTGIEGATDLSHAHFISSASPSSDFNPSQTPNAGQNLDEQDLSTLSTSDLNSPSIKSPNGENNLSKWQGKLSPTSSHLFKLLIPLPTSSNSDDNSRQTAFLLHPSQPLSHLTRLILGSLPKNKKWIECEINYMSVTGEAKDLDSHLRNANEEEQEQEQKEKRQEGGPFLNERNKEKGRFQEVSWSQSTDLSDFVKQSCLNEKFKIVITPTLDENENSSTINQSKQKNEELILEVIIPSFASRTHYIRRRLMSLTKELDKMTKQKKIIDYQAHKGAQRLAVAALGGGVVYWAAVIRWTFFTDAGWDLMEPVTWATGFAALLGSAAFLIYHNREVSYSSLLDLSITARQRKLYDEAGLDIEKWTEMVSEAKTLRKEINRIASDYDIEWKGELENLAEISKKDKQLKDNNTSSSDSNSLTSTSNGEKINQKNEQNKEKVNEVNEEKLDIDKTIEEASELAEQSENKRSKEKSSQRKGEVIDSNLNKDEGDRGSKARKGQEKESDSELQGKKRAKEIIDK